MQLSVSESGRWVSCCRSCLKQVETSGFWDYLGMKLRFGRLLTKGENYSWSSSCLPVRSRQAVHHFHRIKLLLFWLDYLLSVIRRCRYCVTTPWNSSSSSYARSSLLYSNDIEQPWSISWVQFNSLFNTRFLDVVGLLEEADFRSTPQLSVWDGGRAQMFQKTVPDDLSGNAETLFAEFRCYSQRSQISMFRRTKTGSEIWLWRLYTDVLEICRNGTSVIQLNARNAVLGRPLQVTVRPMLRDRCAACLVCLSVTLVYCCQTVGWIKIPWCGGRPRPRLHRKTLA